MAEPFRTATGQTGMDAYLYEAAQIANAQRELTQRFRELLTVVHEEAPEVFLSPSDWHPQLLSENWIPSEFVKYLRESRER